MIYIKIELWPFGDESRKRLLGETFIANDGTGTPTTGNYRAILSTKGRKAWRKAEVKNFPRKRLNVYDLLYRILKEAVSSRNEPKPKESNAGIIDQIIA